MPHARNRFCCMRMRPRRNRFGCSRSSTRSPSCASPRSARTRCVLVSTPACLHCAHRRSSAARAPGGRCILHATCVLHVALLRSQCALSVAMLHAARNLSHVACALRRGGLAHGQVGDGLDDATTMGAPFPSLPFPSLPFPSLPFRFRLCVCARAHASEQQSCRVRPSTAEHGVVW